MADYRRAEAILTSPLPSPQLPHPLPAWQADLLLNNDKSLAPHTSQVFTQATKLWDDRHLPFHSHDASSTFDETAAASERENRPYTAITGGLGGAIQSSLNVNAPGYESDFASRQFVRSPGGPMVDWSMACRYLATLCLVCIHSS